MSMLGSVTELTGGNVGAQRLLWRALDILESDSDEALELARKATTAFDDAGESDNAADASRLVVSATFSSGDIEGAVSLASEQLEAAKGDQPTQAYAHLMWAELMLALGKSEELKEHARLAIQLFQELGKKSCVAKCLSALAQASIQECDGVEAEKLAQEAMALWKELGDKRGVAVAWHLLSAARSVSGQGSLMEPLLKALDLYRELRWRRLEATALYNLSERQRFEPNGGLTAQRTAEEAVNIWRSLGNYKGEATAMTAVAKAMVFRGLKSDALQMLQDRLDELRTPEKKCALVHLGSGCVAAMQDCGADEEALALATEMLAITQEIENRHEEAWMLKKMSEVRSCMKQYPEALACAQEAQTIFQELGDQNGEEEAMKSLSHIYTAKREAHKAPYRQRALDVLGQFATSVAKMDAEGFQTALTQLRLYQGVDGQDVAASLAGLLEDPDIYKWYVEASAEYFQVSPEEAESMVGRAPGNPMQHAQAFDARGFAGGGLYLAFRAGAMGYGPSFRPIQQVYRQGRPMEAEQGAPPVVLGVLRDETVEEWERVALMQAHAGVLDGALQLTAMYHKSFTNHFDEFTKYKRNQLQEVQAS